VCVCLLLRQVLRSLLDIVLGPFLPPTPRRDDFRIGFAPQQAGISHRRVYHVSSDVRKSGWCWSGSAYFSRHCQRRGLPSLSPTPTLHVYYTCAARAVYSRPRRDVFFAAPKKKIHHVFSSLSPLDLADVHRLWKSSRSSRR